MRLLLELQNNFIAHDLAFDTDGVAPRAKMNQQRARRFRSSKDNQLAEEMEEILRKQFEKEGKPVLPKEESQVFDSNVITPGTEFMYTLSKKLESYIRQRISGSAAWSNIKVFEIFVLRVLFQGNNSYPVLLKID
ncbi:5'-3' exoribonuclease [Forsythia ovata]|uniref:5'-3' exoribonuclease n=1 Tax=Forsythia ovata TaxID=205694 RepID=A0ABD1X5W4_9LAMI